MSKLVIESWAIVEDFDPYKAPEQIKKRLTGNVYGHPRFEDGEVITTSSLVEFDLVNRKAITRTGSVYLLGAPSPEYLEIFPQAGV